MFGSVGGTEFLLILVLALLLFGPRKLPQIGRSLGKAISEFRGATNEFKSALEHEVESERLRETGSEAAAVGREAREALNDAGKLSVARGALAGSHPRPDPTGEPGGEEHSGGEPS